MGAIDLLLREAEQFVAGSGIQIQQTLERGEHMASLVDRHVKIGAQDLDQERCNRQVCRSGCGVPIPLAPCLQMPTNEGLYRLEHGPVWRRRTTLASAAHRRFWRSMSIGGFRPGLEVVRRRLGRSMFARHL